MGARARVSGPPPRSGRLVRQLGQRERGQVRMDVQPDLPCVQWCPRQHEARYSRLPDPAQLGQRLRRLLRAVLLGRTTTRPPRSRRTAARRARSDRGGGTFAARLTARSTRGCAPEIEPAGALFSELLRVDLQWKTDVGVGSGGIDGPLGLGDGEGCADEGWLLGDGDGAAPPPVEDAPAEG